MENLNIKRDLTNETHGIFRILQISFAVVLVILGIGLSVYMTIKGTNDKWISLVIMGFGIGVFFVDRLKRIKAGDFVDVELYSIIQPSVHATVESREFTTTVLQNKDDINSQNIVLPGKDAPPFDLLDESIRFVSIPQADPMTPMYMLDEYFRILDWNDAFALAFDNTMNGRRGENVSEWVYWLDNFEEVIEHGVAKFNNPDKLPVYDREEIKFTSEKYGKIIGDKHAYHIPQGENNYVGWLVVIKPTFEESSKKTQYCLNLIKHIRNSYSWSEYAHYYDVLLNNTDVYPKLLSTITGIVRKASGMNKYPSPIAEKSKVLDLGAGTGNLSALLSEPSDQRLVVAIENNPTMLDILKSKLSDRLIDSRDECGVIIRRQDIVELYGIENNFFDYVIGINVLYTLDYSSAVSALKGVYRVLKSGGEIRLSGPKENVDLSLLFKQIKKDLINNQHFDEKMENIFNTVYAINRLFLYPMLEKWGIKTLKKALLVSGFDVITFETDNIYAGQAVIVCARKS